MEAFFVAIAHSYIIIINLKKGGMGMYVFEDGGWDFFDPYKWGWIMIETYNKQMLEEELQEKLFLKKKKNLTKFIEVQRKATPIIQQIPLFDRFIKKVEILLEEKRKEREQISNRFPNQSRETANQLISNQKVANRLLLSKFKKACSLATSLASQQPSQELEIGASSFNKKQEDESRIDNLNKYSQNQQLPNASSINHNNLYKKPYRIHAHKCAKYFKKHPQLFQALGKNLELLLVQLQSNNTQHNLIPKLQHVLPFRLHQIKFNKDTLKFDDWWILELFKQQYVMIMQRGDNYLESSTIDSHSYNKKNPFNINSYLFEYDEEDVFDYFLQVCRALAELVEHKIYHMDMETQNIIPFKDQQRIKYKIIDFEIALFLDSSDKRVQETLAKIWRLIKKYKTSSEVVKNLFDKMLCREHFQISERFDIQLYTTLSRLQNQRQFVDYLLNCMEYYYRNSLLNILHLIMKGTTRLQDNYDRILDIIKTQPFQNIPQQVQGLRSNHS